MNNLAPSEKSDLLKSIDANCQYPGHPMMVSMAIMVAFNTYKDASPKSSPECDHRDSMTAYSSMLVPGAGCAVTRALGLLKRGLENDYTAKQLTEECKQSWVNYISEQECYIKYINPGIEKSAPFEDRFMALWNHWKQGQLSKPEEIENTNHCNMNKC